jgi:transposase InsO family protein
VGWVRDKHPKKESPRVSRTAEEPGQTLNVDLCFVPVEHQAEIKLPAVSGSSGRLVVEQLVSPKAEPDYPGQVFADETLSYSEAMLKFVTASQASAEPKEQADRDKADLKAQKKALRRQQTDLRDQHRHIRQRRHQQDQAWQQLKAQRRQQQQTRKKQRQPGQRSPWGSLRTEDELWRQLRQQRRLQIEQRKQEDQLWHQQRLALRQQAAQLPLVTIWVAILVITDNCTRQCLGLPLFVAGSHLTADMVVEALQTLLPPDLQFLISDRGVHFTADVFKKLARDAEFIHVLIARHRPQSNGIAERFVRSLKEWLRDKSWQTVQELDLLLAQFLADYNDCPHQGLPIAGLSPNEFANRIWLF